MAGPAPKAMGRSLLTVQCSLCRREITSVHIKCAECAPSIDMCLECFAAGVESTAWPSHRRTHAYRVMDSLSSFPVYDPSWSAKEELALLDGIDMYGFGNWREIANFIGTKTEGACQKHYLSIYLNGPPVPLAAGGGLVADGGAEAAQAASSSGSGGAAAAEPSPTGAGAATPAVPASSASGPAAPSGRGGAPTSSSSGGTPGYSHAHIPKTDVAGYMPLRGDFDIEYDNDAEAVLGDMEFVEGEHATETELKLKILEIYNAKLDERERRKAFIIERGLLEYKRLLAAERRRPKEERDVYDAFRPFARFMSPAEHEELVRGVILENRLRKRIAQLQEYRRLGIKSLAEAQEYEAARKRHGGAVGFGAAAAGGGGAASAGGAGGGRRGGRGTAAAAAAAAPDGDVEMAPPPSARAASAGGRARGSRRGGAAEDDDAVMAGPGGEEGAAGGKRNSAAGGAEGVKGAAASAPPFSLDGMPGASRLSPEERRLCESLRMLPSEYAQVKASIINVALVRGHLRRGDLVGSGGDNGVSLLQVDVAKVNGVYDLCVASGWVPGEGGAAASL